MIRIKINNDSITLTGHANSALHGQDLVCCAVSVLFQNLIFSIERLTDDNIYYDLNSGYAWLRYKTLSDVSRTLTESFFIGIKELMKAYPECLSLEDDKS